MIARATRRSLHRPPMSSAAARLALVACLAGIGSCADEPPVEPGDPCAGARGMEARGGTEYGVVVYRDCLEVASWNHEADGVTAGELIVPAGESTERCEVRVIDHALPREEVTNRPGIIELTAECFELSWTVEDESIATLESLPDERWGFVVNGHAPGHTRVTFAISRGTLSDLVLGPIDVVVEDASATSPEDMDFTIVLNGIRALFVRDGQLVPSCETTTADPGHLEATVGHITDGHYSFRRLVEPCNTETFDEDVYHLAYEFADPCIASIVDHPEHFGVLTTFHLEGLSPGTTDMRIRLLEGSDILYRSPWLPVVVTDPDPGPGTTGSLRLEVSFVASDSTGATVPVALGASEHRTAFGNAFQVDAVRLFLTGLALDDCTGTLTPLRAWQYVDASSPSTLVFQIDDIRATHYCDIVFTIGFEEAANETGALPSTYDHMAWPEALGGGYHYMMLEGQILDTTRGTLPFGTFTGRIREGKDPADPHTVAVVLSPHFQILPDKVKVVQLVVDLDEWYEDPHTIDLTEHASDIRGDAAMQQLLEENGATVISLGAITTEDLLR